MDNLQKLEKEFHKLYQESVSTGCNEAFTLSVLRTMVECSPRIKAGDEIWYVDFEEKIIERGIVSNAVYDGDKLDVFSVDFPDTDDFDEFFGEALNKTFFTNKEAALLALSYNKE